MEKLEIRAVIKYQFLKGSKPQEIIDDFQKTLGESAPSNATVYNWYNEFRRGRTSIETIPSPGRPTEVTTRESYWPDGYREFSQWSKKRIVSLLLSAVWRCMFGARFHQICVPISNDG